jgi:H+/Cl- antiporter ClcA
MNDPSFFKNLVPVTSLIALVISSLLAVCGGGALGSEAVLINISMITLLFASDLFKNSIKQINLESLLYIGYIFGFTFAFKSPISSFVLAIEKSIMGHSKNILTNVIYSCIAIGVAYLFIGNDKIFPNSKPLEYNTESGLSGLSRLSGLSGLSSILQYGGLALLSGIFTSVLFKFMYKMYFLTKHLVLNNSIMLNIVPILLGLCVAFIINKTGKVSTNQGKRALNDMFGGKWVYNYKNITGHIINIILTFVSGCSGGLLIPSISIGSYIGFLYNKISSLPMLQTLLVGMTSVFSAFFGYPLSSAFVIQNILNQGIETLPLLILMSYISYYSYKYFNKIVFSE